MLVTSFHPIVVALAAWVYRKADWVLPGSPDVIGVAWVWSLGRGRQGFQDFSVVVLTIVWLNYRP